MKRYPSTYSYLFIITILGASAQAQTTNNSDLPPLKTPAVAAVPAAAPQTIPANVAASVATVSTANATTPSTATAVSTAAANAASNSVAASAANLASTTAATSNAAVSTATAAVTPPAKVIEHEMSADDLKKGGIKISFSNGDIVFRAPDAYAVCLANVSRAEEPVVKRSENADADASSFESAQAFYDASPVVAYKLSYKDSKFKSLKECNDAQASGEKGSADFESRMRAKDVAKDECMTIGFLENSKDEEADPVVSAPSKNQIRSSSCKKMADVIEHVHCDHCTLDYTKVTKQLDIIDDQPASASPLRLALLQKGLGDLGNEIEKANSPAQIRKIREQIRQYANLSAKLRLSTADSQGITLSLSNAVASLQSRAGSLAFDDPNGAGEYADLISENGLVFEKMRGLDDKTRKTQSGVADAYAKNGSLRLAFVSNVDPDNVEVRQTLNSAPQYLNQLARNTQKACAIQFSQKALDRCTQAKANYQEQKSQIEGLAKRWASIQNMPTASKENNFGTNGAALPDGAYHPMVASMSTTPNPQNPVLSFAQPVENSGAFPQKKSMYEVNPNLYRSSGDSQYKVESNTVMIPLNSDLFNLPSA